MITRRIGVLVLALGLAACADTQPATDQGVEDNGNVGELSLSLTGADSDGRAYRLRNGVFDLYGYPEQGDGSEFYQESVSTEDDPDAPTINKRLVPGYYEVNFASYDWYLERLSEAGEWERVEEAVLLSSRYQTAYVYNGNSTMVAYRFGVDGQLIDFRAGELDIGIEIEQPGEGAPDCVPPINPWPFPMPWPCAEADGGVMEPDGDTGEGSADGAF
jgi:hypothetical protein